MYLYVVFLLFCFGEHLIFLLVFVEELIEGPASSPCCTLEETNAAFCAFDSTALCFFSSFAWASASLFKVACCLASL
jgi:hypothetical protein